ncbi:MAG: L,D-transpeptidase family protein [Coprococcus sp.]|nr:L,D-transpeptidase family protein [Coprococcus sp.]
MKKLVESIILFCGIIFILGYTVSGANAAEGFMGMTESTEESGTTEEPVPEVKTGWYTDEKGDKYYYQNGVPVVNQVLAIAETAGGVQTVYYYGFGFNGVMFKNTMKTIGNHTYYFKADGKAAIGFFTYSGYHFFSDSKGAIVKNSFKTIHNNRYYFGSNGKAQTGLRKIGNAYYYFSTKGVLVKNKWVTISGKRYYIGAKGRAVTGLKRISGYLFYFNKYGVMQKNRFVTVKESGNSYYVGSRGKALTGLRKIKKHYYYFRSNARMVKSKWATISGKRYYFGKNGKAYVGARKVEGSKYYYNFGKNAYLKGGIRTIKGVKYRFGNDGKPYTGWYTSKAGNMYYYKANGTLVKNRPYVVNGKLYLFSKTGIRYRKSGFKIVNGRRYYVQDNGTLAKGYTNINDDYYFFSKNGVMYQKKWAYVNGYKFYFDEKGRRLTDVDEVLGKQDSYLIKVNKTKNVVTVYAEDGSNGYIIPVKAFICSTGEATPVGTFYTPYKYRWLTLMGPCWGQWCTQVYGDILFHSVYYGTENDNNTLSVSAYNKLGTTCSHGCIRLTAGDAKWIYDNCSLRTQVNVFYSNDEGPFPKPSAAKLEYWHTWDPTDPNMEYKCRQVGCNH